MDRLSQIDVVIGAGKRLLANEQSAERLKQLPILASEEAFSGWRYIVLPQWAGDIHPKGKPGILVPCFGGGQQGWEQYDWWRGAFELLTCAWEREWEKAHGPCHSYGFRLGGDVRDVFDHAWVNRIILFLRRWWSELHTQGETESFGALPAPVLHLTHDVDAVSKTLALRLKKAIFLLFNALRYKKPTLVLDAFSYALSKSDYWRFDEVAELEDRYGRKSVWNVYGGGGGWLRNPLALLMDPGYSLKDPKIIRQLRSLHERGHSIGLHQAFSSWENTRAMAREKYAVEQALAVAVQHCRQHWLRFSLEKTWVAQKTAGLVYDMTLGFNDRAGFRCAAALTFTEPYSKMTVTPLVLMDSHLYDYRLMDTTQRQRAIDEILAELKQTSGEASIIWHPHVFDSDYGWGEGYAYLLERMKELGFEAPR